MNKKNNLIKRIWFGELPLNVVYWIYNVIVSAILIGISAAVDGNIEIKYLRVYGFIWFVFLLSYQILIGVGIWRSADAYKGRKVWGTLAKISVVLAFMTAITTTIDVIKNLNSTDSLSNGTSNVITEMSKILPVKIDAETRMDKINLVDNTINQQFTLINIDINNGNTEITNTIKNTILPNTCSNEIWIGFLQKGFTINSVYNNKNNIELAKFSVSKEDCNNLEAMKISLSNVQLLNENKDLLDTKSTGNNLANLLNGIVKVVEPYNKKMIKLQEEMNKIDISFAVLTDIFTNKTKLLETKSTLNIFIQNTNNQRELMMEMSEATLLYIQNFDIDKNQKDEFMQSYTQSQNTVTALLKQKYSLWDKMSSNIQIILDLATTNFGKVEVKNNTLLFSSNKIAAKYNLARADLQKNAADEEVLTKELVEYEAKRKSKLNNLVL